MSRAHERAYHLLAERVRLGASARRTLYGVLAALAGSGLWWLTVHYAPALFPTRFDDVQRIAHEALALKVHGATAFAALLTLGAMGAYHVRRGWQLERNRLSGAATISAFAVLIVTGYALYYLVSDETRPPVSVLHWGIGLALVPLLIVHIALGRRSRGAPVGGRGARRHV